MTTTTEHAQKLTGLKRLRKERRLTLTENFRKILELPKQETVTHPPLYGIQEIETYTIEDTEEWLKWRKTKIMPSASMIASLFGVGYRSFNVEFKDLVGLTERPEPVGIGKKLIDHGKEHEHRARCAYIDYFSKEENFEVTQDGHQSKVMEISNGTRNFAFLVTPDLTIKHVYPSILTGSKVVEIKCPAYGIVTKKKNLDKVWYDFCQRFPEGRPAHFLQSAMYAVAFQTELFDLFYFFTDGINELFFNASFKLTESAKKLILEGIESCWVHIDRYNAEKKLNYPIVKNKKAHEIVISQIMKECFIHSVMHHVTESELLQEDASNDGEQ